MLINVNMLSPYVLWSKFRCFSGGLRSGKHVKCKRTSFGSTSTPQIMSRVSENKKHKRFFEVNICVLGFVFTKLITMFQEYTT